MSVIVNFVFKGRDLVIPTLNELSIIFDKVLCSGEKYTLPSGVERIISYGYAEISTEVKEMKLEHFLDDKLSLIRKDIDKLKFMGLEEIVLYLTFKYKNQYNWEFSSVFLGKLSELGIVLAISAYEAK